MYYKKVKELCESEGISIRKVEETLEIGNGTIGSWNIPKADGKMPTPSIPVLKKIAEYFQVTISYFLF